MSLAVLSIIHLANFMVTYFKASLRYLYVTCDYFNGLAYSCCADFKHNNKGREGRGSSMTGVGWGLNVGEKERRNNMLLWNFHDVNMDSRHAKLTNFCCLPCHIFCTGRTELYLLEKKCKSWKKNNRLNRTTIHTISE